MPAPMIRVDLKLLQWATPAQAKYIQAISDHKGILPACRALGLSKNTVYLALKRVEKKAAIFGYSPRHDLTRPVAPGQRLRGASLLYKRGEPEPLLTWVKSKEDDEQREAIIRGQIEAVKAEIPRLSAVKAPAHTDADLCTLYTFTDCHVGMYAWAKETGAPWDLKIAEDMLTQAFQYLVQASPPAQRCIINQLGDFVHFDGLDAITPTNKHPLDADSRFEKVANVAALILRRVVDMALLKHREVVVVIKEGNHDIASSVWLRTLFAMLYEKEPRVVVNQDVSPYTALQHGTNFLGFHHGHLAKKETLPLLFAARHRDVWGQTKRGYIHTGHYHHVEEKEHPGVKVIQHPTMAAPDSYNTRNGYESEREMTSITYHAEYGQVARNTVTPDMLKAAA